MISPQSTTVESCPEYHPLTRSVTPVADSASRLTGYSTDLTPVTLHLKHFMLNQSRATSVEWLEP